METKEKILSEAFTLFCRRGIKGVSMDDIAMHLGMSKKTIYKWFENKDEMVEAALKNYLYGIHADCDRMSAKSQNAVEELFLVMDSIRQKMAGVHPSVFYDMQRFYPEAFKVWTLFKNEVIKLQIITNLKRGISEGLYRQDFDLEIVARLRLLQVEHAFNPDFFPPDRFNLQDVQSAILDHFMLGIASMKGHKMINKFKKVLEED